MPPFFSIHQTFWTSRMSPIGSRGSPYLCNPLCSMEEKDTAKSNCPCLKIILYVIFWEPTYSFQFFAYSKGWIHLTLLSPKIVVVWYSTVSSEFAPFWSAITSTQGITDPITIPFIPVTFIYFMECSTDTAKFKLLKRKFNALTSSSSIRCEVWWIKLQPGGNLVPSLWHRLRHVVQIGLIRFYSAI